MWYVRAAKAKNLYKYHKFQHTMKVSSKSYRVIEHAMTYVQKIRKLKCISSNLVQLCIADQVLYITLKAPLARLASDTTHLNGNY